MGGALPLCWIRIQELGGRMNLSADAISGSAFCCSRRASSGGQRGCAGLSGGDQGDVGHPENERWQLFDDATWPVLLGGDNLLTDHGNDIQHLATTTTCSPSNNHGLRWDLAGAVNALVPAGTGLRPVQ